MPTLGSRKKNRAAACKSYPEEVHADETVELTAKDNLMLKTLSQFHAGSTSGGDIENKAVAAHVTQHSDSGFPTCCPYTQS